MRDLKDYLAIRKPVIRRFHRRNCAPTVTIDMDVDIGPALAWKKTLESAPQARDAKPTLNAIILKATANALREHIFFNYDYDGRYGIIPNERICLRSPMDMGDFPLHIVVEDTDKKSVFQIAREYQENAEKARALIEKNLPKYLRFHRLPLLPRISGGVTDLYRAVQPWLPPLERLAFRMSHKVIGTFMVTNLGSLGVTACHGQLVKPSIAALLVLAIREDVVYAPDGTPAVRKVLPLALEFDHKVADAGFSSRFLADIKKNLENPESGCANRG